jgi:hypothetical protein
MACKPNNIPIDVAAQSVFSAQSAKSAGFIPIFCHFCTFSPSAQSLTIPYKLNKYLHHGKDNWN